MVLEKPLSLFWKNTYFKNIFRIRLIVMLENVFKLSLIVILWSIFSFSNI